MADQRLPAGRTEPPPGADGPGDGRITGKHELAAAAAALAGGLIVGGGFWGRGVVFHCLDCTFAVKARGTKGASEARLLYRRVIPSEGRLVVRT
jgi:hypothetical protein